jgi:hypothetical protein
MDVRSLARAEANQATGRKVGASAAELLANVAAMLPPIERAAIVGGLGPVELEAAGVVVRLGESTRNRASEAAASSISSSGSKAARVAARAGADSPAARNPDSPAS